MEQEQELSAHEAAIQRAEQQNLEQTVDAELFTPEEYDPMDPDGTLDVEV